MCGWYQYRPGSGNYASPQAFQAAIGQSGFREVSAAIGYRAHPGLYQVIRK
jgi:hypothetical protein